MRDFKKGDLIAKRHCATNEMLQVGIVISDNIECFEVQWVWYNKSFFMEKEQDIFKELNNMHLLNAERYTRSDPNPLLCHVDNSYKHGSQEKIANPHQEID